MSCLFERVCLFAGISFIYLFDDIFPYPLGIFRKIRYTKLFPCVLNIAVNWFLPFFQSVKTHLLFCFVLGLEFV